MLTDIFSERYLSTNMWDVFTEKDAKFLVQGYRMVSEQLYPYYVNGKASPAAKERWTSIHDKLSMELGLTKLSPIRYHFQSTYNGNPVTQSGAWSMDKVCNDFVNASYDGSIPVDRFIKERISFIELFFREREEQIAQINSNLPKLIAETKLREKLKTSSSQVDLINIHNEILNQSFQTTVKELNERLLRAGYNLNYHNGFIQISDDTLIEEQIENEFWSITKSLIWGNVDLDMKEAIDLRDGNIGDPAFYAARALESTIKIISDQKNWTHGGEKGAHNFIENLSSKKNGSFINGWERDTLKSFFTTIRNPFGHGAGSKDMVKLTRQQTNWAIETCMSWVKSLIKRM